MIIEGLFEIFSNLALWVLDIINLPDMPPQIMEIMQTVKGYMLQGGNVVSLFVNWPLFLLLGTTAIGIIIAREGYLLLMWILNKIPFIDID